MANFPLPSEIQRTYLTLLKSIKPNLNINDLNSDFVIRGKAITGLLSGLYGDQAKINQDTFTSTARPEALLLKGADLGLSLNEATQASGASVVVSGTDGTVITAGQLSFVYIPTGLFYTNTSGGTISGGHLTVSVRCDVAGAQGNVLAQDELTVISPPSGVDVTAEVTGNIAGGSDVETYESFRSRILARQQYVPAGGNQSDYLAWGYEADPSVRSVTIRRFIKGLGTVGVAITTGVTDVDSAVTNGTPVVRIPSAEVLLRVQAYYDQISPLTDCVTVFGPTETAVDVTVAVKAAAGLTLDSVPSSPVYNPQGLTVRQLVVREVGRSLYKTAIGGRKIGGSSGGFVVASDIEANLDTWLGPAGFIPCLDDRQVYPLDGTSYDKAIDANSLVTPGTITVVNGVP